LGGGSALISTEPRAEAPLDDNTLRDIQYIFKRPGD
jgi:hypothetical protein